MNAFTLILVAFIAFASGFVPRSSLTHSVPIRQIKRMQIFAQLGRVTMYKKESCPYCKKARELLEGKYGLTVTFVDIETSAPEKKDEILQQMRTFSGGRNTVPQIFFNSDHLGGNDDVQKLDVDGKLAQMVEKVKSTEVSMMQDGWYHPWY